MFFFANNVNDTCLPRIIRSDRLFTPTEYNYVAIECNYQHNLCRQMKGSLTVVFQQNRITQVDGWR